MSNEQTVYRVTFAMAGSFVSVVVLGGVVLLFRMYADDVPAAVLVWVGVGWLVFWALLLTLVFRSATVVTTAGVQARQMFSTRFYPWARIADVRVEETAGPGAKVAIYGVVLYDADLRRVVLPYVNHRRLGMERLDVETAALRDCWESRRGPDWQSRAAELAHRAETRRTRNLVWVWAALAAVAGFVLAIVFDVVVLIAASGTPFVESAVFEMLPLFILIAPVTAFVLTAVIGLVVRHARMRGGRTP